MRFLNSLLSLKGKRIDIVAWGLIIFALLLRLALIVNGWPETDGEEGTMGLVALHIIQRGEHPIYFYGQHYMGVGEAYIAALIYHLLGAFISPLMALRLAMLLLFALFLIFVYQLSRLLFNRSVTLIALLILALGARDLLIPEMKAVGGAIETLVCGTLVLLLATWLSLSYAPEHGRHPQRGHGGGESGPYETSSNNNPGRIAPMWRRWLAYGAWGLTVGLGLWSHLLVVPFIFTSLVLLIICCRRELRSRAMLFLLAGLLVGALPLIAYNLSAPSNENSLAVFWTLFQTPDHTAPTGWLLLIKKLMGTDLYALPIATGAGRPCPKLEIYPIYGQPGPGTLRCVLMQSSWSIGYLSLLVLATVLSLVSLIKYWRIQRSNHFVADSTIRLGWPSGKVIASEHGRHAQRGHGECGPYETSSTEPQREFIRNVARFMLLLGGWATLLLFAASTSAAQRPWSTRYLIGLLIITPALLRPIVDGLRFVLKRSRSSRRSFFGAAFRLALLAIILTVFTIGTVQNFQAIPYSQHYQTRQDRLIQKLLSLGVTRVYSGYWICDRLNLQSQERIICSVINGDLTPGLTRYSPYTAIVKAAPRPAYIFADPTYYNPEFPCPPATLKQLRTNHHYHEIRMDGFMIFIHA